MPLDIVGEKAMDIIQTGRRLKGTLLMKMKQHKIFSLLLLLIVFFFLFPVRYSVSFENGKGEPIAGKISAGFGFWNNTEQGENVAVWVPRGKHTLLFSAPYRVRVEELRRTWWNPLPVRKVVQLYPDTFTYENATFKDLLGVEWSPEIRVQGKDIDGEHVELQGNRYSKIPFGTYNITFEKKWVSNETIFYPGDLTNNTILLVPNNQTVVLSEREVNWVKNFMRDYLDFSSTGMLELPGWSRQFHIATKNVTLTLGDMLFVLCQEKEQHPVIFVPRTNVYEKGEGEHCYESLFEGKVPLTVNGIRSEQYFYNLLKGTKRTIPYEFGELNQRIHKLDWALSFDIEYGRYVPKVGLSNVTFSSCKVSSEYLTPEQCEDADFAGWVSQSTEHVWFTEYEYPVSSGLIGWRWMLELSDEYGIPTTQFLVSKDVDLFGKRDPVILEFAKQLAQEGLVEVGSHTRYHTRLSEVPYSVAVEELRQSKFELERTFNVRIQGFRNPYLSLIENSSSATEQALAETGYSYYSLYGQPHVTTFNGTTIEHKPINFFGYLGYVDPKLLNDALGFQYIISLDHPWNIQFHEKETPKGIVLEEAPRQPLQSKAFILEAMSRGAEFTTMEKIKTV